MTTTLEANTVRWMMVRMKDDEWDDGRIMEALAREQFVADENPMTLVVEVREHAGWFCEFGWDGDLVRLGTANCANRDARATAWRSATRHMDYTHIGTYHRQ